MDRLAKILADDTPTALRARDRVVLHVLPYGSFDQSIKLSIQELKAEENSFIPLGQGTGFGLYPRINLDGLLSTQGNPNTSGAKAYTQVWRSGRVELVVSSIRAPSGTGGSVVPTDVVEDILVQAVGSVLAGLEKLAVPHPLVVFAALVGVQGVQLDGGHTYEESRFDRDVIHTSEIIVFEPFDLGPSNDRHKIEASLR